MKVQILVGNIASGKSTWISNNAKIRDAVLSKDDFRKEDVSK